MKFTDHLLREQFTGKLRNVLVAALGERGEHRVDRWVQTHVHAFFLEAHPLRLGRLETSMTPRIEDVLLLQAEPFEHARDPFGDRCAAPPLPELEPVVVRLVDLHAVRNLLLSQKGAITALPQWCLAHFLAYSDGL